MFMLGICLYACMYVHACVWHAIVRYYGETFVRWYVCVYMHTRNKSFVMARRVCKCMDACMYEHTCVMVTLCICVMHMCEGQVMYVCEGSCCACV